MIYLFIRHCEEAISWRVVSDQKDCRAALAMTVCFTYFLAVFMASGVYQIGDE